MKWFCDTCGESNLLGGIVQQTSKTKARYRHCYFCEMEVTVTLREDDYETGEDLPEDRPTLRYESRVWNEWKERRAKRNEQRD